MLILFCWTNLFAQQSGSQQAGSQLVGEITELAGTVELKPAGEANFIPAKAGDRVVRDTIISTGFKSSALIKAGSALLTVRPLTRLSFSEISSSSGSESLNVSIQTGRVRVDVKPPAGTRTAMTVQSPIATASVRGTSFEFDTQSITVLEGTVAFQGSEGGEMFVSAGFGSEINVNGRSTDPMDYFITELLPPPPAGSDTGFINGGTSGSSSTSDAEFDIDFELH